MLYARLVHRSSVLLALAFLCSLGPSAAADLQEQAVDYYSVQFSGRFRDGRGTFDLRVACNEMSAKDLRKIKFLGADTDGPRCVVRVLSFSLNGKEVLLPPQSYADLANVSIGGGVYVTTRGNLVVLHVHGGDGENAYETRYLIRNEELVAREVEELSADGEPSVRKQTYQGNKPKNPHKER